jgi:hypothetical protein
MITPEVTLNMPAQSLVPGTTHTYSDSLGQEVDNLVAVDASRLQPLLPPGYVIVPASNFFGVGRANQGVVAIANFRGMHPLIDGISVLDNDVAIDVGIVVAEPAAAAGAGLSIPGAFHLYTLAIYTNDPLYAVVLSVAKPWRNASRQNSHGQVGVPHQPSANLSKCMHSRTA